MAELYRIITDNIVYHRTLKGITQQAFAEKMGLKKSTYHLKEKNADFTPEEVSKAEKILGLPKKSLEIDEGRSNKKIKIDDVAVTLVQTNIEIIASQRVILSVLAEMNAPSLKSPSKAVADIYRKMVIDEAKQVQDEISD